MTPPDNRETWVHKQRAIVAACDQLADACIITPPAIGRVAAAVADLPAWAAAALFDRIRDAALK